MKWESFSGKEPSTVVLVDSAWILHKNFNAVKLTTNLNGVVVPTGHLYGSSRLVSSLMGRRDWALVYVMDDAPMSKIEVAGDYKAGRPKAGFSLKDSMEELEYLVTPFPGVYSARSDGNEADDVIATMAVTLSQAGQEVVIFSGDNDMLPLIWDKVKIARRLTKDKMECVDQEYIHDKYGVESDGISMYKVLMGCDSDHVPPITGMTQSIAVKLISKYKGDVESFLNKDWKNPALRDEAFRNYELTRLRKDVKVRLVKRTPQEGLIVARKYKLGAMTSMLTALLTPAKGVGKGWG